jgi:F-type H+-transporting ATPase subunit gamma
MAGIRQIFYRRRAVENICRITRTMGIISTAKYKYYFNKRVAIVDYHNALARAAYLLITSEKPVRHPVLNINSSGHSAVFAIGSVRGLCGSYNNSVSRLVQTHVNRARESGRNLDVYATDGRLISILRHYGIVPTKVFAESEQMLAGDQIDHLADKFVKQYMAGQLDDFEVVYMHFHSAVSQRVQTLAIMPLVELIDDLSTRTAVIWPWELSFEDFLLSPHAEEIIESLAGAIIRMSIHRCLIDAVLSEHTARMFAMRNATENAEEIIENLTGEYNKARQNQITRELLDVIGGSGALG